MSELKEIAEKALRLNPLDKARLIDMLFQSYDDEGRAEIDAKWIAESERRIDAYDRGELGGTPAEVVFKRILG